MDAMWGVETQSTSGADNNEDALPNSERPVAEGEMLTIVDRARQVQQSAE